MTSSANVTASPYLPNQRFFPDEPSLIQRELNNSYSDIARSVNARDIAIYSQSAVATGQRFDIMQNTMSQEAQRKVTMFGTIAPGATSSMPHELTGFSMFTRIYGVATTAIDWRPMPYTSATAVNAQIELLVTPTLITIINGAASQNIVSAIVVVEFI